MTTNNENRLYLWNKDGEEDASEVKGSDAGLGVACISLDHLPLGLSLKYKVSQHPTKGCRKASADGPRT